MTLFSSVLTYISWSHLIIRLVVFLRINCILILLPHILLHQREDEAHKDDLAKVRHVDRTKRNERVIPHRPASFSRTWGDSYINDNVAIWSVDVRTHDGMAKAAAHFGFEEEWIKHVIDYPDEPIQKRFYQLVLFKAMFANSGRGSTALHWSPEEGMHRMIAALLLMTLSSVNLHDGSLNGAMTLEYSDLVKMGCMREPDDGWTSIPTIQEQCDYHVYGETNNILPLTMRYFSAPASRNPSSQLLAACRGKSKDTSDDKHNSAGKRVTSVVYHFIRDEYDDVNESQFRMMATPSLPVTDSFKNAPFKFTAAVKTSKKETMTEGEETFKYAVPEVLTRTEAKNYFANPLDEKNKQAFVRLFPATATVGKETKTIYPPFVYDKQTLFNASGSHMNPEQVNLIYFFCPIVYITMSILNDKNPEWCEQVCRFVSWYTLCRTVEESDRVKMHGVVGINYPLIGIGAYLFGHKSIIGSLIYLTHKANLIFYRDTAAVMPWKFKQGIYTLTAVTPTFSSVKEDLDIKESWFRDWCGKLHLTHPGVNDNDLMLRVLREYDIFCLFRRVYHRVLFDRILPFFTFDTVH